MNIPVPQFVSTYLDYGLSGLPGRKMRQRRMLNLLSLLIFATGLFYVVLFLTHDARRLWPAAATSALFALFLLLPRIARASDTAALAFAVGLTMTLQISLTWMLSTESGMHLFLFAVPSLAIVCFGTDRLPLFVGLVVLCSAAMVISTVLFRDPASYITVNETLLTFLRSSVFIGISSFVMTGVYIGFDRAITAEDALEQEYERSETLLYNLLPQHVATRLKADPGQTIADTLPEVAILFADIVDFTPRSSRMQADEVVDFLNLVFSAFDTLAEHHGLEKIKTIGDAYMVAAGMPDSEGDPVHRVAAMALDMLEVARTLSHDMREPVDVRICLHAGPAVAGVIGNRKLFYDVWGETVNIASRMERLGEPGRIQVTDAAREALKDTYRFEHRGMVDVKGIGPVDAWWLTGRA